MKVRENLEMVNKVMKVLSGERFPPRTFSVTRLIGCPRKTYFRMKGTFEFVPESRILIFTRGRGIHNELERGFATSEVRREVDGIRGDIDAVGDRVTEIYSTGMSSSKIKDLSDVYKVFETKVKQLMAYCYMTGGKEGDLLVFFMSGDYTRFTEVAGKTVYTGIQPQLKCWTLKFTDEELNENWKQMLSNKEDIELALKTGTPPLTVGKKWECAYCGFENICFGEEEKKE